MQELAKRGHKITISSDGRVMKMVKDGKPEKAHVAFLWAAGGGPALGRAVCFTCAHLTCAHFTCFCLSLSACLNPVPASDFSNVLREASPDP